MTKKKLVLRIIYFLEHRFLSVKRNTICLVKKNRMIRADGMHVSGVNCVCTSQFMELAKLLNKEKKKKRGRKELQVAVDFVLIQTDCFHRAAYVIFTTSFHVCSLIKAKQRIRLNNNCCSRSKTTLHSLCLYSDYKLI